MRALVCFLIIFSNFLFSVPALKDVPASGYLVEYRQGLDETERRMIFKVLEKEKKGTWFEVVLEISPGMTNIVKVLADINEDGSQDIYRMIRQSPGMPPLEDSSEMISRMGSVIEKQYNLLTGYIEKFRALETNENYTYRREKNKIVEVGGKKFTCLYEEAVQKGTGKKYDLYTSDNIYPFGIFKAKTLVEEIEVEIILHRYQKEGARSSIKNSDIQKAPSLPGR